MSAVQATSPWEWLDKLRPNIVALIGDEAAADRHIQACRTHIRASNLNGTCSVDSLAQCVLSSAQLRIAPGSGELTFTRRKGAAAIDVSFRGWVTLAWRKGIVLDAHAVYEGDRFAYVLGSESSLQHEPALCSDQRDLLCAYAIAKFPGGHKLIEIVDISAIEKARAASPSGRGAYSPWSTHYGEMARKTAAKRLAKYLPLGEDVSAATSFHEPIDIPALEVRQRPSARDVLQKIAERQAIAPAVDVDAEPVYEVGGGQ